MFEGISILFLFAVILAIGSLAGFIATRLSLPALTGQIIAGIVMGEAGINIIPASSRESFFPIATLALSLIAVTVGGHLEFRRLHNAIRRIMIISICQFTVIFWLVLVFFQIFNPLNIAHELALPAHMLIATIATSSSPVSIIHIIKEQRARGLLVKTAIAVLAINNLLTLLVFEVLHGIASAIISSRHTIAGAIGIAITGELLALTIGLLCGVALVVYCRFVLKSNGAQGGQRTQHQTTIVNGQMFTGFLVAICFASGLCELLTHQFSHLDMHPSPVLANMMLGLTLANTSSFKEELLRLFRTLETGIFTCFFVLAGAHLNVVDLRLAWPAATLFLLIRGVGMIGGGYIGSRLSNSTKKNAVHIGRMLMSQGAIAITLVILLKANPLFSDTAGLMVATVVAACIASEIIGPVLMGRSLKQTGEAHQDRARLIEFLQEEYIDPNVHADNKWDAIESLCYFMCRVHNIKEHPRQVLTAIREREESMPTGIGLGVAVPHAKINVGKDILGVLGRLDPPVDFGAEDGEAARIVVMIATPEDQAQKHIQVIAAVSKMMSNETVRRAVFAADTAEKIHDIIDSEEVSTFNYFLET